MRILMITILAPVLWLAAIAPSLAGDDDIAVVIGNRTYQANIPAVEFAHNDADAMRQYFIERYGVLAGNILDLRDASQAAMQSAFGNDRTHKGKLWRWLKPGKSNVYVYYSGHGVPGLSDQRGYLLPVDADPDAPEINGFPVDVLYENLQKLQARSVTVFLDACFSGESPRGMLIRAASGVVLTPKLPEQAGKLTVLTAAQGNQVASWDESARHGLFTRHLLDGLRGAADSTDYGTLDGAITLGELKAYLDDTMTYAARRSYGRVQTVSTLGRETTVIASLPVQRADRISDLPRPSAQSISDGRPANYADRPTRRDAPPLPRERSASRPASTQLAAATPRAPVGRPQDFDGDWRIEITFHINGNDYRHVDEVTVRNGAFEENLDFQDIRLGKHTQRNWIIQGKVDGRGQMVGSVLHYAHVDAIAFDLDGSLEKATGIAPHKSWTTTIAGRRK